MLNKLICLLILLTSTGVSQDLSYYLQQSDSLDQAGNLTYAVEMMREAVDKFPDQSDAYAFLGIYLGKSAGQSTGQQNQASLAFESFKMLDKAVELDSQNVNARFFRGIMGINVPPFMGKLDQAILDFNVIIEINQHENVDQEVLISTYQGLARGYEKSKNYSGAIDCWEQLQNITEDVEILDRASEKIIQLEELIESEDQGTIEYTDMNVGELLTEAQDLYNQRRYEQAEQVLLMAIQNDSNSVEAYSLLTKVYLSMSQEGYNEKIAEDTDYRTNLCFKTMNCLDRVLQLDPDNTEMRLIRGIMGINFPFFVGKLDQGINDLEIVLENTTSLEIEREIMFNLGLAYYKKAISNWINIVTENPDCPQAQIIYESLNPDKSRGDLSDQQPPYLLIEFILGIQDELPPQTAIWIEDEQGDFVKTIYVSGFAGYVKNVQVTLPQWANSSNFETDANTSASIDIGYHSYIWDLTDSKDQLVTAGKHTVYVEVCHWPSNLYQLQTADIDLSGEPCNVLVQEGNLISRLELTYIKD
ncbi:MAG: hypothetical protein APR63_06365 [Desulfuromonas sp. SDB]|nr:MAG: hypothetical protein APR63_06365 [Desulfuromonas sp. SDB]